MSDTDLGDKVVDIHTDSKGTHAVPRIHAQLRADGIRFRNGRAARIMRQGRRPGRCQRRGRKTIIQIPTPKLR